MTNKISYYISLLLGIIFFSFILFHIMPSDPARMILGPSADERQASVLRHELGLDQPLHIQFYRYIKGLCRMDMGKSYIDRRSVYEEVMERFKISLTLVSLAFLMVLLYSLLTIFEDPLLTRIQASLNFLFLSVPTFFSGTVIALFIFLYYPYTSFSGQILSLNDFIFLLFPAFVIALYPMGTQAKILKASMDKSKTAAYVKFALANGYTEGYIRINLRLKNSIIPYLSALSNQLPILFTGVFIVEVIFNIPGMGSLLVKSILNRDIPMMHGLVILNGLLFILINLFFEMVYPLIDPRIGGANEQH